MPVAHTCNLATQESDEEDCGSKPDWANSSLKILNTHKKKGWQSG
jgi:hypothetical protein